MWDIAEGGDVAGGRGDGGSPQEDGLPEAIAWLRKRASFFDRSRPLVMVRAPGRLDVMGGIADYSGSLVLEYPIRAATWLFAQAGHAGESAQPGGRGGPQLVIESAGGGADGGAAAGGEAAWGETTVALAIGDLTPRRGPLEYEEAHRALRADPRRAWAAYVAGALVVLHRERGAVLSDGARVLIYSTVPPGSGLSSSAALEVAAFEALANLAGAPVDERDLALLAQKVENLVVGAPCGVMDQMTVALGRRDHLLEILCQPAEVRGHLPLPRELELWGLGSGIRHAVSGADYGGVRAAAFMGFRMIADIAGMLAAVDCDAVPPRVQAGGQGQVDDPLYGGYLANVPPALWRSRYRDLVPPHIEGRAFLGRYGASPDDVTAVAPERTYAVRACTEHPILEHERVERFRNLMAAGGGDEGRWGELGQLMYASHVSYSACGLGSEGTDQLVELVRATGPAGGLYGAKVTGGGSGGTVAVLGRRGSGDAVRAIAVRYQAETGRRCDVVSGSSPGARVFGTRRLVAV